jgi:diguanylate cyclase (GGDEF)-like protein
MSEPANQTRVLLIGADPDDELLLERAAEVAPELVPEAVPEDSPEFGTVGADVMLFGFPPIDGLGLLEWTRGAIGAVPIVVLASESEASFEIPAIRAGADDFLVREATGGPDLARALKVAVARSRREREGAGVDPLTGLRTLDGLAPIALHEMRQADRTKAVPVLVVLSIDGIAQVRVSHGSNEVQRLVREVSEAIVDVTREADVPAHVSLGTFCVLLTGNAAGAEEMVLGRLVESIARGNARSESPLPLSLSVGVARYDSADPVGLDELLQRARSSMRAAEFAGETEN